MPLIILNRIEEMRKQSKTFPDGTKLMTRLNRLIIIINNFCFTSSRKNSYWAEFLYRKILAANTTAQIKMESSLSSTSERKLI